MNLLLFTENVLRSNSKLTHSLGCLIDDDQLKFENFVADFSLNIFMSFLFVSVLEEPSYEPEQFF